MRRIDLIALLPPRETARRLWSETCRRNSRGRNRTEQGRAALLHQEVAANRSEQRKVDGQQWGRRWSAGRMRRPPGIAPQVELVVTYTHYPDHRPYRSE